MERAEILAWRRGKRDELIASRMALPQAAHAEADAVIARRIDTCLDDIDPCLVGAYWPFRREFNVLPVLDQLIVRGFSVALPVVLGKGQPLEFRRWTRDTRLASGVYDIPYPAEGEAVQPTMLIVPLVGFDDDGYRLGYGGGFYDRTLEAMASRPFCLGVGFELGHLPTIHPLSHDIPMNAIATEKSFYIRD
ncbi:MAG TPA: 5-formyltetrahydrofolate cyclo-ligase [Stellaceae bacterium]|jgi:5,10-methenyltetrahydrofolate synthetase